MIRWREEDKDQNLGYHGYMLRMVYVYESNLDSG